MQWFRMYHEFAFDPVIQSLSFDDQRHFVVALCLKASGVLDREYADQQERARVLRRAFGLESVAFDEARNRLCKAGLIDKNWQPINWDKRQFISDSDPTAAERKRKQRLRESGSHEDVTRDASVSHVSGSVSVSESASDRTTKEDKTPLTPRQPERWEEFRAAMPKREGSQRTQDAIRAWNARLKEGVNPESIIAGAKRYAEYVRLSRTEPRYVQQHASFLGRNRGWEEAWTVERAGTSGRRYWVQDPNGAPGEMIEVDGSTLKPWERERLDREQSVHEEMFARR